MSQHNSYKQQQSHSTNHSNHHTPILNKHKNVSPFPITSRNASPLQKRMENSPLHIPLAIALKKLGQEITKNQYSQRYELKANTDLQNIKNVLQEFAQSLYLSVERQLYSKFNIEMKRIIIKYRQTQKLLHKIQQKLAFHADILMDDQNLRRKSQQNHKKVQQLERNNQLLVNQLQQQSQSLNQAIIEKSKLQQQNSKMSLRVQQIQNAFFMKMQEIQHYKSHVNNQSQPKSSYHQSVASTMSNHQKSQHSSMVNSHISNLNQLTPTHSPIQKKKLKLKDNIKKLPQVSAINLKKADN